MPASYHVLGWVSVLFFSLSLIGIATQLREIWQRKRRRLQLESPTEFDRPTAVLSLNQFFASFLAFYSFLVYGFCLEPFNHYLVWTRLVATALVLVIIYEIWDDRRGRLPTLTLVASLFMLLAAVSLLTFARGIVSEGRIASAWLAVFAATVFGQGIIHQVARVRQTGHTGAVSLRMHQLTTCKDLSTIGFALAMPMADGWPLMAVGGAGVGTKVVLMWHFRWARLSPVAAARRRETLANRELNDET